jgi:(S)-sulfolactate dehydrogenase
MRVVISEFMDPAAVDRLRAHFDISYDPALVEHPERLHDALADAGALIVRNRTPVNAALLARASHLKVVGRLGVGLDNIDLDACRTRGIEVIPATGANAQTVAEFVVCTAMMLLRGVYGASAEVAAGRWPRAALSGGRELAGKLLGLVGFGGIGQATARLARACGMRLVAHDPVLAPEHPIAREFGVELLDLEPLLVVADVVTLHLPLTHATRELLDNRRLALLKRGAVLINTARGGIVDEAALAERLRSGHLGGAALDVYEIEPLPAASPLAGIPNLILTPHVAGVTRESNARVSDLIAERVIEFLLP